ncbi:MAG: ATP-binding cassette domain-containing protein [Bacteroidales bacterium]|nr:ATP-binding cassette domain-containing protein [Bacteroidales bacterium]
MNAIEVENISKSYGSVKALDNVSLSVGESEIVGLIGPDGAGKTTLFRILATLLLPDSGHALIDGIDVEKARRQVRSSIGYMPGRFSLYPDLSVKENIEFYASVFGVPVKKGYQLIAPVYQQIAPFARRPAGKLSGGMKQKLALCCALIHRPKVLLLDEPTTGVDVVSRQEFWDLLYDLRSQGIAILASTPYMDEAHRCQRVALISQGRIMETDTPDNLLQKHACSTVEDVFIKLMDQKSTSTATSGHSSGERPRCPAISSREAEPPSITVQGLTKRFGDFTAVDNITFDVAKGEIFGFLGANGAGKTTAMRMLTGLSIPTEGRGTVGGYDVLTQGEEIKRHIGYMSQRFSLYDDLSVWDNIHFFGGIYGMRPKEIDRNGRRLLEELRFYDRRQEKVADIPLGWKQKLAFAVAMLHDPSIVFLDEPTGGVDPVVRRQFWDLIRSAADRGVTIFVTTHYMDEAELCDRVSIMVDGKIAAIGSPTELKQQMHSNTMQQVFYLLAREGQRQ